MDFDAAVRELATLVETLEREGDERALILLELIDAVHRPALERIAAGDLDDPHAQALLAMYDLVEVDPLVLAEEALDEVRPYIESHGGDVELIGVEDGRVHVRLSGACVGCAGSAMTLQRGVEDALRRHLPGFEKVVAQEPEAPLLQLGDLRRPVFADVDAVPGPGELSTVLVDGTPILLAGVDGEVFAFRNRCAVDGLPLDGGRLAGTVIVCPFHNCAYDARTGRRVDEENAAGLAVVPVAIQDGAVRVAVNVT